MVLLRLGLVRKKVLLFVNSINEGFRLRLFLEAFGIRSAVLNAELPLNSRHHILQVQATHGSCGFAESDKHCQHYTITVSLHCAAKYGYYKYRVCSEATRFHLTLQRVWISISAAFGLTCEHFWIMVSHTDSLSIND